MSNEVGGVDYAGEIESEKDIGSEPRDVVSRWLKELDIAAREEKEWRDAVTEAIEVYQGEKGKIGTKFNIYHSNVQTVVPALYNSSPQPDVRRRHGDRDPVAKQSADVLERILTHEIDAYDFDGTMESTIQDLVICGRGVARVTYRATTAPLMGDNGPLLSDSGEPVHDIAYQSVGCKYVPWATYRRGPARSFDELPWIAFADYYTRKGLEELSNPQIASKVALDMRVDSGASGKESTEGAAGDNPESDIFKRALVWEIWDKQKRQVIYVSPGYKDGPIATVDDPLGLEQFFPVPKPMQGVIVTGSLVPVCDYGLFKTLYDELDEITGRITALIRQLRVRGITPGGEGNADIQRWSEADDGEVIVAQGLGALMDRGDVSKLIAWWPMEATIQALQQLYLQRDQVKQSIYEATGLSDILRGQTNPNETLGAQEIKQQWGSLRIQKRQQEVQRFIRDLFRLKAEIISQKFTKENLILASGLQDDPILMGVPEAPQPAPLTPPGPMPPIRNSDVYPAVNAAVNGAMPPGMMGMPGAAMQ